MHLRPFILYQAEKYFKAKHFKWDRMTILQLYMALGGISYYFSLLEPSKSAAENIADDLCRKLDEAKKGADYLEQLYNQKQLSLELLVKGIEKRG